MRLLLNRPLIRLAALCLVVGTLGCPKKAPTNIAGTDDELFDSLGAKLEELRSRGGAIADCNDACALKADACGLSSAICDAAGRKTDRADFQKKCEQAQEECARANDQCSGCKK